MTTLKIKDLPLDEQRQRWYEAACNRIDLDRLKQLVFDLTAKHSPTGAEREASEFMAGYLNSVGIDARYQPVTDISGNCYGRVKGSGDGPALMLYAPIDTLLEGDPEKDIPHAGPTQRADMVPEPYIDGDLVIGLGASNPKSMLALLTEALTCVVEAEVALKGDVLIATAGGGMPWIVPERNYAGVSSGVSHLLSHGVTADFGVICKPWDDIYYEHPGMVWFKVTTWGTMGYAGIPRGGAGLSQLNHTRGEGHPGFGRMVEGIPGQAHQRPGKAAGLDLRLALWLAGQTGVSRRGDRDLSRPEDQSPAKGG